MLRRELLRLLTSLPLLNHRWARLAPGSDPRQDAPNAAAVYRRAFAWLDGVPKAEWAAAREALDAPKLPPHVDRWLDAARPAPAALREAAEVDDCRWGDEAMRLTFFDRDRLKIGNRHLVKLACLSARRRAETMQSNAALDGSFAALLFARRVGTGGPRIARLFECNDEIATYQTLGRILPLLDRPALDSLTRRLDALPAIAPVGLESRFILASIRKGLVGAGPVLDDGDWGRIGLDEGETASLKTLTGGDRDRFLAHLDATGPAFAELARRLDLPRPDLDAALEDFSRSHRATDPIPAGLAPKLRGARDAVDRSRLFQAMLRAGLTLVRDGDGAFRGLHDPYGAGPFDLERRDRGRVVRSEFPGIKAAKTELRIGDLC